MIAQLWKVFQCAKSTEIVILALIWACWSCDRHRITITSHDRNFQLPWDYRSRGWGKNPLLFPAAERLKMFKPQQWLKFVYGTNCKMWKKSCQTHPHTAQMRLMEHLVLAERVDGCADLLLGCTPSLVLRSTPDIHQLWYGVFLLLHARLSLSAESRSGPLSI